MRPEFSSRNPSVGLAVTRRVCAGALVCIVALASSARAEWKVATSEHETSPNELVEHWTTMVTNDETAGHATLHLAVFTTRAATLRVIDQPDSELVEVMNRTKSLAGTNGGYFDPENAPVGLLVSAGRTLSPFRKAKLLSGVLTVSGGRIDIVRASRFAPNEKILEALQCGPLLVERAAPVAGLNDTRPARRTFVAIDNHGHAAVGVTSAVSLAQLGRILCLTNATGNLKIVRALNLDGGSSTAFWFAGNDGAFSIGELKTVRDFVAVVAR